MKDLGSQLEKIAPEANKLVICDSMSDARAAVERNRSALTDTNEKKHFSEKRQDAAIIYDFDLFIQKLV